MMGIAPHIQLILLQQPRGAITFYKESDPKDAIWVLVIIAAIAVIVFVIHLISKGRRSSPAGNGKTGTSTPRRFNAFNFYKTASGYGLDKDQTKLLETIFRNESVSDPERVLKNHALLDRHFKKTYKTITKNSATDEDTQQRLIRLFSLRNAIEAAPGAGTVPPGQLAENTPAILVSGNDNFPVKVLASKGLNIVTEIPRNAIGTPVRLSSGTKVTLSFFTRSSKGFSYDGQVVGVIDISQGQGLHIVHTGKIKALVKRMYRRRQTTIRCAFYYVFLDEETGIIRKKSSRLVVDTRRFTGTILDISIGGCSIKTTTPIQASARLKITIDYSNNSAINVLGQVLRINRSSPAGIIIHIKFLKVPRRAFNSISAMVFGYDEE